MVTVRCIACERGQGPMSLHHFDPGGCDGAFGGATFTLDLHPDPDNHSLIVRRMTPAATAPRTATPDSGARASTSKEAHGCETRRSRPQSTATPRDEHGMKDHQCINRETSRNRVTAEQSPTAEGSAGASSHCAATGASSGQRSAQGQHQAAPRSPITR